MGKPQSLAGATVLAIDTPALIVDLDAMERNLQRMSRFAQMSKIALRPHAKTHKSIHLASRQLALGAVGVCCQTVSEAEVMVAGGIRDVLVTNQVVGSNKIERLLRLAMSARVGVCVDDFNNVDALDAATRSCDIDLDIYIEIDVGAHRCGVSPGTPALELSRRVLNAPRLRFMGLQAYNGPAQHLYDPTARRRAADEVIARARQTRDLLQRHGIECRVISGGGTGSYSVDAASGVFNELQPGSYVFMDGAYARNIPLDEEPHRAFEQSLYVLTTVISCARAETAVVDAGLKAIGIDAGMPDVADFAAVKYTRASDEHGTLQLGPDAPKLRPGDVLRLVPGNCDPTINLYDRYVGCRGQEVETCWPVSARGHGE